MFTHTGAGTCAAFPSARAAVDAVVAAKLDIEVEPRLAGR
jgi:hypothetical protein